MTNEDKMRRIIAKIIGVANEAAGHRLTGPTEDDARVYAALLSKDPAILSATYNVKTRSIDIVPAPMADMVSINFKVDS